MRLIEFFEDDKHQLSCTRLLLFMMIASFLVWASKLVWATNAIPDVPLQFAGLCSLLYGINKVGGAYYKSVDGGQTDAQKNP